MVFPQRQWSGGGELFRQTPVTVVILGIWVAGFFAALIGAPIVRLFAFIPNVFPNMVTGLATYPLVMGRDFIGLLLTGLVFYWFGGSLERSWGSRSYGLFLLATSVAAAVVWEIGILLVLRELVPLGSPWLLLSSVIVAWAWLNPEATILLMFVLPVKAKWVGWLTIAFLYFLFPPQFGVAGALQLVLGFFALGGVAVAYWYTKWRREWGWIPRRRESRRTSRVIRHPASSPWRRLLRPFEDWQRRRRIARLERTFKFDDDQRMSD